ncbi:acyl-CoA dehydrogenase family protein [Dactylosporangium sucinum]|uniref:Acyl-CoA dehydrogenase (FadE) n=1 Tax=Dactylosporangium sucinum TaxID=1424081 RepID=A0A917WWL3_9ACTN|nr:acyl-CoA dehydrogenase family protein [Dactylosporangium sucinum]GGM35747.1 putative acyl-CoA dehydrogenase (FadE) [Dactylosporangium sucinum]
MRRSIYGPDHELFRESVRSFLDRHVRPHHDRFIEQGSIDRGVWLEAGKQGFLGLGVPTEYGGVDAGDYRFNAVLVEELSHVSVALASCLGIHVDCVTPYLVDLATEEQKRRWLPRFCAGELVTAIAMTEPSGGSDLAALRTTAARRGSTWVINGSKTFITNGASADLVVAAVRTGPGSGSKGISLFAIGTDVPGVHRGRKLDKVGQPEADTAELFFDDVAVSDADLLGEVGRGFEYMMERLTQERLNSAISNLAHAAQLLAETVSYAKDRTAFGQAIGSFQYNKFLLAEFSTTIDVTQAFVDQCTLAHVDGQLGPTEAAKAKWWTAEVQNRVLDGCVQLHGGYGFMRESRIARGWTDARVTKIWAGSNEIMKELIGRSLGL